MTQQAPQPDSPQKDTQSKKKTERPRDLRKRNKRLDESRNLHRQKNREKSIELKAKIGKIHDLKTSRDMWRSRSSDYEDQFVQLHKKVEEKDRLLSKQKQLIDAQAKLLEKEQTLRLSEAEEQNKQINNLKKKLMKYSEHYPIIRQQK